MSMSESSASGYIPEEDYYKGLNTPPKKNEVVVELDPSLTTEEDYDPEANIREDLQRALKPRHINMISIAGVIGTGLYLSTAKSLYQGGPASLFMNYTIMGGVVSVSYTHLDVYKRQVHKQLKQQHLFSSSLYLFPQMRCSN